MSNIKDIVKKEELYYTGNSFALFVHKRVEKITTAIYLVTDFLLDKEPLKFILREKSVKLMSHIMSLRIEQMSFREKSFFAVDLLIQEINSSLKIALSTKLISEMNYSILKLELKKILDLIKEREKEGEDKKGVLPENFFGQKKDFEGSPGIFFKRHQYKGHLQSKGQLNIENKTTKLERRPSSGVIKKTPNRSITSKRLLLNNIKKERRDKILKIIKDNKEVTIKDIIKKVRDCSEKTIQRDLVAMLSEGVLKKKGERRWSTYSLN